MIVTDKVIVSLSRYKNGYLHKRGIKSLIKHINKIQNNNEQFAVSDLPLLLLNLL